MAFSDKDVKRIGVIILIALIAVLTFFIVRPVLLSVLAGLLLAYVFYPVYKYILKKLKSRNLAAILVTIIVLAIIFIPLWFLAPTIIQEIFELFQASQGFDSGNVIAKIFPDSPQLVNQASLAINNAIGKISSFILNAFIDFLINAAVVSLHLFLVAFVFYFSIRDAPQLKKFVSGISPLHRKQEKNLVKQFEGITKSIILGQIIVGIVQGTLAGIGLWIFGVPNVFLLTMFALVLSIIPVIGPGLLYVPVALYLVITGSPFMAIGYIIYNLLLVSTVENALRAHIIARNSELSQIIALIGMIGGLFMFGVMGILIGPLILAYFVTILRAYKDKSLSSFFAHTN